MREIDRLRPQRSSTAQAFYRFKHALGRWQQETSSDHVKKFIEEARVTMNQKCVEMDDATRRFNHEAEALAEFVGGL